MDEEEGEKIEEGAIFEGAVSEVEMAQGGMLGDRKKVSDGRESEGASDPDLLKIWKGGEEGEEERENVG